MAEETANVVLRTQTISAFQIRV